MTSTPPPHTREQPENEDNVTNEKEKAGEYVTGTDDAHNNDTPHGSPVEVMG